MNLALNNVQANNLHIDFDKQFLPNNWKRVEFIGRPGLSDGKIRAKYYDENGKCFKTKNELQKFFGSKYDLSIFDFRTGKLSPFLIKKSLQKAKLAQSNQLQTPFRRKPLLNPCLAKIKVNTIKTQPNSKVNTELEIKPNDLNKTEKPKQVFWEKRLSNLTTKFNSNDENNLLPKKIKLFGPEIDNQTAIRSISAALHLSGQGIVGQNEKVLDKNPSVFINTDQPLVQALIITEDDIRKQEERVLNARKKLEQAIKDNLEYNL